MINLIMPMAGRGSRFKKNGYEQPKPLIQLHGKPFFWWSIQSVIRYVEVSQLVCVILQEHIDQHDIKNKILEYFPQANFAVLEKVTQGALDSAINGLKCIKENYPILINDCDHAFDATGLKQIIADLPTTTDAYLCHFSSQSAAYSYALYGEQGYLIKTAEKEVISKQAIAGLYIFSNPKIILQYAQLYKQQCPYDEIYISGLYNLMCADSKLIKGFNLPSHISFGTPTELDLVMQSMKYIDWVETD